MPYYLIPILKKKKLFIVRRCSLNQLEMEIMNIYSQINRLNKLKKAYLFFKRAKFI